MVKIGEEELTTIFVGEMGIKQVCVGNESLYKRPGGYLYLELDTKGEE